MSNAKEAPKRVYADGSEIRIGDVVTLRNGHVDAREIRYIGKISAFNENPGKGFSVVVDVERIGGELIADCVQTALYEVEDAGKISPDDYEQLDAEVDEDGDYKEGGQPYQFIFHRPERDLVKV